MPKSKLTRGLLEQIAVELRRDIVAGRFAPGDQLVERQLAQRFGVSHAPIREALLQLTQEGLLVSTTNRGAQIAPVARPAIRRLFTPIRQTLESYALALCFDELNEVDFQAWSEILQQLEAGCRSRNAALIAQQDFALHEAIVERAGQPDVLAGWRAMVARVRLDLRAGLDEYAHSGQIHSDHVEIIRKCREHDREGALKALEYNIVVETNGLETSAPAVV